MTEKHTWYLWFDNDCGEEQLWDKDEAFCLKLRKATPPSATPDDAYYAGVVVDQYMETDGSDRDYEDGDYEIVYVEDELGRRYKIESTATITIEWNSDGEFIEPEDPREVLEDLGQTPLFPNELLFSQHD